MFKKQLIPEDASSILDSISRQIDLYHKEIYEYGWDESNFDVDRLIHECFSGPAFPYEQMPLVKEILTSLYSHTDALWQPEIDFDEQEEFDFE